jgi:hypothetical protein
MRQVAPSLQVTLPLGPTVISQVEPPEQSTLHDAPHEPVHSLSLVQSRLQLPPSQAEPSVVQAVPASHAHEVPLQVGVGTSSSLPPHPIAVST